MSYALIPDPDHEGGWFLIVDGVSQSYVDTRDETSLRFSYVRRIATVIDTVAPKGRPLRVLHLGAGAMTLPRYVGRTRPGSAQVVVDHDPALLAYVGRHVPLPAGLDLTTIISDARAAAEDFDDASFEVVIADVYMGAQMPHSVATVEFARHAARILAPGGVFVTNLADLPPLAFSRVQAATLRTAFPDVCAIGEPGMLRGRRYGNVVLAAALVPDQLPVVRLARLARADDKPARLLRGADLDAFIGGAVPLTDATTPAV